MTARINQKLYYSRLLMNQASATVPEPLRQALLEAGVWHLATAYRSHLLEIARAFAEDFAISNAPGEPPRPAVNAAVLAEALATRELRCAELDYLAELEKRGDWPAQLLAVVNRLSALDDASAKNGVPQRSQAEPAGSNTLSVVTLDAGLDEARCRGWLEAFESLLTAQRESLQEW